MQNDKIFQICKQFNELSEQLSKSVNARLSEFKIPMENLQTTLTNFANEYQKMPPKIRYVQNFLARRGWYLSGSSDLKDILQLYNFIQDGNEKAVERFMISHAKDEIEQISKGLSYSYPKRFPLLNDAFNAHNNQLYSLSIPVFLAQADGISHEILGVSFYSKVSSENGKGISEPKTKRALKRKLVNKVDHSDAIEIFFLRPLEVLSSIAFGTDQRNKEKDNDPYFGPLNRHGVLHGIDLDYNTEANSLRLIFLLDYLTNLKKHYF